MCRNIKTLFNFEPPANADEIHAASLQYVRKIAGFTRPSRQNEAAFEQAVSEIQQISTQLIQSLETKAPAKNRDVEAAKKRARNEARFG